MCGRCASTKDMNQLGIEFGAQLGGRVRESARRRVGKRLPSTRHQHLTDHIDTKRRCPVRVALAGPPGEIGWMMHTSLRSRAANSS